MRALLTAFEPFGGDETNGSAEVAKAVQAAWQPQWGELRVEILPVTFTAAPRLLRHCVTAWAPDVVVCLGEAGGRPGLTVERRAHVEVDARIPDNEGAQPRGQRLDAGPEWLAAPVNVDRLAAAMSSGATQVDVSDDAGRFVCNAVCRAAAPLGGVFIHVPAFRPEQQTASVGVETDGRRAVRPEISVADAAATVVRGIHHLAQPGPVTDLGEPA